MAISQQKPQAVCFLAVCEDWKRISMIGPITVRQELSSARRDEMHISYHAFDISYNFPFLEKKIMHFHNHKKKKKNTPTPPKKQTKNPRNKQKKKKN